jgi:predicted amidohydrolase
MANSFALSPKWERAENRGLGEAKPLIFRVRGKSMHTPLLRLAAAQTVPVAGDVAANLAAHLRLIERAASAGADLILFPELSLSGYEPDAVTRCAMMPGDEAVERLSAKATETGMTILAGTPVVSLAGKPCIGMAVFVPGGLSVYRKYFLHPGEERFASPGPSHPFLGEIKGEKFACAICADTSHPEHAKAAAKAGAALYVVGACWSAKGYGPSAAQLQSYAARHDMAVLLANFGGPSGGYDCAGISAFWAPGGKLIVAAPNRGECLIVASRFDAGWSGEVVA